MTFSAVRPSRCVVDLDAIRHNVRRLSGDDSAQVCAVVKADGYGHGAVAVARAAVEAGATWLAVALVEEAAALRAAGISDPILLLSEPPPSAADAVCALELVPFVYSAEFVAALDEAASRRDTTVRVHLKVDTGMGRVGVTPPALRAVAAQLAACDRLVVDGIGTHLARADEDDTDAQAETLRQLALFDQLLDVLARQPLRPQFLHAANTAAALRYPTSRNLTFPGLGTTTLLRCGIGVYGLSPSDDVTAHGHGLRPALTVHSAVSFVKHVPAGTPVSYGHRWRAPSDGYLATVPIGYADGIPRALTNRTDCVINGRRVPIVGTVTMDQVMVWSGEVPLTAGDPVLLLGSAGPSATIRMDEWAAATGTITYEIASQLTARLPREYQAVSSADGGRETLR